MKILVFGVCRDILNASEVVIELPDASTVSVLRENLTAEYPDLLKLNSLMIAVNNVYSEEDLIIGKTDEVALIPPVSGG